MPQQRVRVASAPGYEDFEAVLIPGLHRTRIGGVEKTVLACDCLTGLHVIPSEYVTLLPLEES